MTVRMLRLRRAVLVAALAGLVLSGCTSDPFADQYGNGGARGTESVDGTILEIPADARAAAPEYGGMTDGGIEVSSADYAGRVVVVNFWYANCGPCRAEAPDLEALHQKHKDSGVTFVGVNTIDQADTALAFARKYGITYPSIMDAGSGEARLAFAGQASPAAVPTTLVLDKEGRVAARFLGQITAPSNLDTVIRELVAEDL